MSNKDKHMDVFDESGCVSSVAMEAYIAGILTTEQKDTISIHLETCELCKDAIEGAAHFKSATSYHKRIEQMHQSAWRRSLDYKGRSRRLYYGLSSVAASLIILFGVFFLLRMDNLFKQKGEFNTPSEIALSSGSTDSIDLYKANDFIKPATEAASKPEKEKQQSKAVLSKSVTPDSPAKKIEEKPMPLVADINNSEEEVEYFAKEETVIDQDEEFVNSEVELSPKAAGKAALTGYQSKPTTTNTAMKRAKSMSEPNALADDNILIEESLDMEMEAASSGSKSFIVAEVMPMFRGGSVDDFNSYLADSLIKILPDSFWHQNILVSFIVEANGEIKKVKLIIGTGDKKMDKQIVELVKASSTWSPGLYQGYPVAVEQQVEVVLDTIKLKSN